MASRWKEAMVLLVAVLLQPILASAQSPKGRQPAAQAKPAANDWMKVPMDPASPDDVLPYIRHLRDEYWDGLLGGAGITLTPSIAVHVNTGDDAGPVGDEPEVHALRADDALLIATFARYRTALTPSRRAIYTEVTFTVSHVFRDADRGHALAGLPITVSLEGGTVKTLAGVITFETDPREYFMQPGKTYLLSLHYMADGDFYVGTAAYEISEGVVKPNSYMARAMAKRGLPTIVGLSHDDLIRALDAQATKKQ